MNPHHGDGLHFLLYGCAFTLFILSTAFLGLAQQQTSLCSNGNNSFSMSLRDGARVELGPDKSGGLAVRTCQATLAL